MPNSLSRFLDAQENTYRQAERELLTGKKTSHWMWFIFPQIEGLGKSPLAQKFAIRTMREARDYLLHPVLGKRLKNLVTILVNGIEGKTAHEIFGFPDDLKLHSSLTLFRSAATEEHTNEFAKEFAPLVDAAIQKYFDGKQDQKTIDLLKRRS